MKLTANEIIKNWETYADSAWFALDKLGNDGKMMRLFVGDIDDARAHLENEVFGCVDYDGTPLDPGDIGFEPFYRVTRIESESARLFFAACASDNTPDDAGILYTVSQAAQVMGRTRQAVHELIKRGRLHAEIILDEWRIDGMAIAEFKPYTR